MEWYNYTAVFFSGLFSANSVPHFYRGVTGKEYPTPFSRPPFRGMSSPGINILWASINVLIAVIMVYFSGLPIVTPLSAVLFLTGISVIGMSAVFFNSGRK